ncbi:MAG: class I tRNA ligase family protein, partial [Treponema sp.]|nr:class I tRNA ligase family protein [Treponema sp.]
CSHTPEVRQTKHLYIDLPAIAPKLQEWVDKTSVTGKWASNAIQMTKAWIRDGLNERAITRDLKWGIPVPKPGYEDKVFYVWFDAPIGYISITAQLANELKQNGLPSFDYKSWWLPNESSSAGKNQNVELFQFIGKDNIPFHTVVFPSSLIGSGRDWTKLFHMSSTEFLNYEDGKFSKSKGVGVFGTDAKESGLSADAWRFYIFYNRPEKSDYQFTWKDFQEKYNSELIGNLGNLVNRTLLFVNKYYDGVIPSSPIDNELFSKVLEKEKRITELLEWSELKEAFHEIFSITDLANKAFQAAEPWKTRNTDIEKCASLIHTLCYVIKDVLIMLHPYLPSYAQKVASFFGKEIIESTIQTPAKKDALCWSDLGKLEGISKIGQTSVYFTPMDNKTMLAFKEKFSGNQKSSGDKKSSEQNKSSKKETPSSPKEEILSPEEMVNHFNKYISLKVAKIISVERNPESDKLYIEHLDDGSGVERVIQSGLVPYLKEDELLGKHIVLVENLAPRKMRGVESRGMLLAADYKDGEKDCVELITAPWAHPGTPIVIEGSDVNATKESEISGDTFFKVQINVKEHNVTIGDKKLVCDGRPLTTEKTQNGEVG